jgi:threonine dehydrogenase-like Zn-dependent dehydrogenase
MRTIYVDKNIPKMLMVKALHRVWPGVVFSAISPARLAVVPEPPLPGPTGVRMRNRVCGICASDLSLFHVHADPAIGLAALPGTSRFYLGHEVVSEIVEVAPQVKKMRAGQRVVMEHRETGASCRELGIEPTCRFCQAGLANLCENSAGTVGIGGGWSDGYTAQASNLYPVPDDLSDDQAAMIEPMSVAIHGVLRRPPGAHERVLVLGAGIIGLFTMQAVRAFRPRARLTALARHPHQARAARHCGADEVVTGGDVYAEMARLTGGRAYAAPLNRGMLMGGFDVIYDCVGSATSITDALRWTRARGTLVLVGIALSVLRVDLSPIWYQEVDLIGSKTHATSEWQGTRRHDYEWAIQFQRSGHMRIEDLITHRFPLAQYRQAIRTATDKRRTHAIKVVFDL